LNDLLVIGAHAFFKGAGFSGGGGGSIKVVPCLYVNISKSIQWYIEFKELFKLPFETQTAATSVRIENVQIEIFCRTSRK